MQNESFHVGGLEVIALTDGATEFGPEIFPDTDPSEIDRLLAEAGASAIRTNFNAFLVKGGQGLTLIDAGPRDLFGPVAGHLPEALSAAGAAPADVTTLFATHLHPDHAGGMVDSNGAAIFTNAELALTEAERVFWSDTDFSGMGEPMEGWAALARQVLSAYAARLRLLDDGQEIAPGITVLAIDGHTPGHAGVRFADGDAQLVHVGDAFHAQHLQLANPQIGVVFDVDGEAARQSRLRLLDMLATERTPVTGGHILAPKFVTLTRAGSGFRIVS